MLAVVVLSTVRLTKSCVYVLFVVRGNKIGWAGHPDWIGKGTFFTQYEKWFGHGVGRGLDYGSKTVCFKKAVFQVERLLYSSSFCVLAVRPTVVVVGWLPVCNPFFFLGLYRIFRQNLGLHTFGLPSRQGRTPRRRGVLARRATLGSSTSTTSSTALNGACCRQLV